MDDQRIACRAVWNVPTTDGVVRPGGIAWLTDAEITVLAALGAVERLAPETAPSAPGPTQPAATEPPAQSPATEPQSAAPVPAEPPPAETPAGEQAAPQEAEATGPAPVPAKGKNPSRK